MAKKSKVAKNQERKKNVTEAKLNPFEIYHKKKKHNVLGVRDKRIAGMPGVSRSRALEKRTKTLGQEYKNRHKKNTFVDGRFGEDSTAMSVEDKMMARFAVERQKHHSKQNFNLEDEVLTHKGQSIEGMEDFGDLNSSDDDGDAVPDNTTDMHFGGFLTKSEHSESAKHLSGKDIMEEIVAKSKLQKMERQKLKEETTEETAELDKDWGELRTLMAAKTKPVVRKEVDDYDTAVKELMFEAKAKPTDRLKTEEELAKERRELLEKLERERQQRMRKDGDPSSESSADALLSLKAIKKDEKVHISYDEKGKMNKNKRFEEALNQLRNKNQEAGSESEESSDEDDGEEDEDDSENGDVENEDGEESEEEADQSDDGDEDNAATVRELPLIQDSTADDMDGNCEIEDVLADDSDEEEKEQPEGDEHKDLSSGTEKHIPFIIDTPEHISALRSLLSGQDEEAVVTILKRIVASNHPTLREDNKAKTASFYVVLVKFLVNSYTDNTLSCYVLNESIKILFSVTKHIQRDLYTHFFDVLNSLKHIVAKNATKQLSVVISKRYVIYMLIVQRIYPVTDYKHPILTPLMLTVSGALSSCSVRKLSDLKVGIFLCNYILGCCKGKFVPEVIYSLTQSIKCLTSGRKEKSQEYVSNFKFGSEFLTDSSKPVKLSIRTLYDNETSKSDVLFGLLLTTRTAMRTYHDYTGFNGIFNSFNESLKKLDTESFHPDIQSISSSISALFSQYSQKTMPFLRYQNIKPVSIKMYEPKFGDVYVRDRKNKDETKHLKKKIKSEMKGAIREIRKDNKFINRVKHKEQAGLDKARKKKVNEIMGFLSKEQGEANDLKYKKKRGQI